jgi:hypothetical protein
VSITLDAWAPPEPTWCADSPEAWFDPRLTTGGDNGRGNRRDARALCSGCPFTTQCLDAALDYERGHPLSQRFGVWGGTLPWEQAAIEKRRGAA